MDARGVIFNLASNVHFCRKNRENQCRVVLTWQVFILQCEQFWSEVWY